MEEKLIKKIKYSGTIELKSGLHIGGSNMSLGVGGIDKSVIRNPIDNMPYIPGSSLKGKLRSLLELRDGTVGEDGKVCEDTSKRVCQLFGSSADKGYPSRLIVRDAKWNEDNKKLFENADLPLKFTESKTEVSINRITAEANPRTIERVPAGAIFDVEIIINIMDSEKDRENELKEALKTAAQLLNEDYLGGHGSRGYGWVTLTLGEPEELFCNLEK